MGCAGFPKVALFPNTTLFRSNRSATCGSAFRRGWEGEGKLNRRPGAGQRAKPATRGRLFCFGKREGKALGVPAHKETGPVRLPQPQRGTSKGTLARRDADGWCARASVRQRPSGKERGKSASGSAQKRRTLKERSGKERVLIKSRPLSRAPDRHRNGQDYRLGARSA